jgi:hypothetical protein
MTNANDWQRNDVRTQIDELLEAAKSHGTQILLDADGTFEITFVPKKQSLKELFSKPGPISNDDVDP